MPSAELGAAGAIPDRPGKPARPDRADLRADCGNCFALCCVGLAFTASQDFAVDKAPGTPCPHLATDDRCSIHTGLRGRGFKGCTVYDCFGAGQKLSKETFGGVSWRGAPPERARLMFATLPVLRQLHEMLWYLAEAETLASASALQ